MESEDTGVYKPSYFHNPGKAPLCTYTIGQKLDIAVENWPDKEAVVSLYQGHRLTFREAREKADKLAAGLLQLGLSPGDRLGIWGPNSTEWYICRLAAARGGFIAVQIDPAYLGPQLLHSLKKVDTRVLICAESYKTNNCYQIVRSVVPELDSCSEGGTELNSSKVPSLKRLIIISDKQHKGAYKYEEVIKSARTETLKKIKQLQTQIQADDGCCIHFSSGTTGTPKGVLLSHHNLVNNAIVLGEMASLHKKDHKILITTQFCHTSGSLAGILCGLCFGKTIVIPWPIFDATKMLEAAVKERCTYLLATPSLIVDMITTSKGKNIKVTTLQTAAFGGAPCSPQLAMDLKETFNVETLLPVYGMTEISIVFGAVPSDVLEQRISTVGKSIEHLEVKVVDKEGRMVPMGTPGELWVRGYNVMLGYWKEEEKTREFIGADRWAKTGDQFILEEDGHGRIVGRVKDMIIRIGDKIFPAEIEEFFTQHPDILECQAFGVPDPKVGEEICVYLRLRNEATLTEEDVREYCKDKIPDYRIPRYIRFVKQFERTMIGKVQKYRLLELLKKELGMK